MYVKKKNGVDCFKHIFKLLTDLKELVLGFHKLVCCGKHITVHVHARQKND